jgi:hypothetical protein
MNNDRNSNNNSNHPNINPDAFDELTDISLNRNVNDQTNGISLNGEDSQTIIRFEIEGSSITFSAPLRGSNEDSSNGGGFRIITSSRQNGRPGRYNFRQRPERDVVSSAVPHLRDGLARLILEVLLLGGVDGQMPHVQGQPPASHDARFSLKTLNTDDIRKSLEIGTSLHVEDCVICRDNYEASSIIREMPCKHFFHEDCLFKWLDNSNQCPTCRYEIMTDNIEYNETVKNRMASRDVEICANEKRKREQEDPEITNQSIKNRLRKRIRPNSGK